MKKRKMSKICALGFVCLLKMSILHGQDSASIQKKINILTALFEKELWCTPMDNDMYPEKYIRLGMPKDMFLKLDSTSLTKYSFAYLLVYDYYVLNQQHRHFNELGTIVGIASDSVSPQYTRIFNLEKLEESGYSWEHRIGSLLVLSPYLFNAILVDGNLIVNFQIKEPFNEKTKARCKVYADYCVMIISKYLMRPRDGIKRIIMEWVDSNKEPLKFETTPGTKEYRAFLKSF